jgi:hypothetical protein
MASERIERAATVTPSHRIATSGFVCSLVIAAIVTIPACGTKRNATIPRGIGGTRVFLVGDSPASARSVSGPEPEPDVSIQKAMSGGEELVEAKQAGSVWCVIVRYRRDKHVRVYLWSPRLGLKPLRDSSFPSGTNVWAICDKSASRIAVAARSDRDFSAWFVDSRFTRLDRFLREPGWWAQGVWAGGRLVLSYSSQDFNHIVLATPGNAKSTEIYRELRATGLRHGQNPILQLLPSVSGRFVAFDRLPSSENTEQGLWLLDMKTQDCRQITDSDASIYSHTLDDWDGPTSILFLSRDSPGTWRHYRAVIPP